ncbi:MAG: hypothetical protein IKA64_03810 [Clostridia bacterium]|nr:hypothetical protein [Clostridia bacterium]
MKSIVLSSAAILLLALAVLLNGYASTSILKKIEDSLTEAEESRGGEALADAEELFTSKRVFLSFTVSDEALGEIEADLKEARRAERAGEVGELESAISRLIATLVQIRRLNGVDFSSVF